MARFRPHFGITPLRTASSRAKEPASEKTARSPDNDNSRDYLRELGDKYKQRNKIALQNQLPSETRSDCTSVHDSNRLNKRPVRWQNVAMILGITSAVATLGGCVFDYKKIDIGNLFYKTEIQNKKNEELANYIAKVTTLPNLDILYPSAVPPFPYPRNR